MGVQEQIINEAKSLFDVAGVSKMPNGDKLLILGLESTEQRNLDDFRHIDSIFHVYGFREHIQPRLESLLDLIKTSGFSAEPLGRYGYPLEGGENLKKHVIATGLGKRGKSTVILHPKYGTRLRFSAVRTDAPLDERADTQTSEEENPFCEGCSVCIDVCPTNVLEPYRMTDTLHCLSNISKVTEEGQSILCDECLKMCPANAD